MDQFNISERESIVLLGAHSVGQYHTPLSVNMLVIIYCSHPKKMLYAKKLYSVRKLNDFYKLFSGNSYLIRSDFGLLSQMLQKRNIKMSEMRDKLKTEPKIG